MLKNHSQDIPKSLSEKEMFIKCAIFSWPLTLLSRSDSEVMHKNENSQTSYPIQPEAAA